MGVGAVASLRPWVAAVATAAAEGAAASPRSRCGAPQLPPPCQVPAPAGAVAPWDCQRLPQSRRAPRCAAAGLWEAAGRLACRAKRCTPTASGPLRGAGQVLLQRGGQAEEHRGKSAEGAEAALESLSWVKMPKMALEEPP